MPYNLKTFLLYFILITLCISCRKKETTSVSGTSQDSVAQTPPVEEVVGDCFMVVTGKDSMLMQIVIENNSAVGQLHYRFYEKDKSGGTFFGDMHGDTLIADYKFMSEGMESEREVAFLRKGETFIEGYGVEEDKDGRMVFKNINSLRFSGQPMQKVDCAPLSWYFAKK